MWRHTGRRGEGPGHFLFPRAVALVVPPIDVEKRGYDGQPDASATPTLIVADGDPYGRIQVTDFFGVIV